MRIGIDIMGGDFAPENTILGALMAHKELPTGVDLVFIGDQDKINELLKRESFICNRCSVVHAPQVIGMADHPSKAFAQKSESSISVGFRMLESGAIDAFASAGNTGAVMVGTMYTVKAIPGIIRPCISATIPREDGKYTILLDVGINPDCRPDVLYQYGILGSLYAEKVFKIENPRVGLLNIGSEEEKGNLLTKATHEVMKGSVDFNFIGNVEGNDLLRTDKADVVISDGFVGNVVLKQMEGVYNMLKSRNLTDSYFERFNFENYGGTPVLGINKTVVIGHGASTPLAIKNMILHTYEVENAHLSEKIKEAFK